MKTARNIALILIALFAMALGAVSYVLVDYLQKDVLSTVVPQLALALGCTSMMSLWCWSDSKLTGTNLTRFSAAIIAIGGFFTVSGYFYRRFGRIGWLKSLLGLWLYALAYVASILGSYAAYAVVLALHG
jgi:hypothetical protein